MIPLWSSMVHITHWCLIYWVLINACHRGQTTKIDHHRMLELRVGAIYGSPSAPPGLRRCRLQTLRLLPFATRMRPPRLQRMSPAPRAQRKEAATAEASEGRLQGDGAARHGVGGRRVVTGDGKPLRKTVENWWMIVDNGMTCWRWSILNGYFYGQW